MIILNPGLLLLTMGQTEICFSMKTDYPRRKVPPIVSKALTLTLYDSRPFMHNKL